MMKNSLNKTNLLLLRLSMYTRIHSSGNRQLSVWRKSKTMANNDKSQSHRLLHDWKSPHRTEGKQRHLTDRWSAYSKQTAQKNREEKGENWKQWQSLSPVSKMSFLKMAVGREKKKRASTTINRKRGNPQPVSRPLPAKPLQSLAQRPLEVMRGIGAGLRAEPWACDPGNVIDQQPAASPGNFFETQFLRLHPPATAAAKPLQSCRTLCDPIDGSPPGSPVPGILQARTLEWIAISFSNAWKWKVKVKSCPTLRDPMDCSLPGSSAHGIFQARVLEWGTIAFCADSTRDLPNQKL